MSRKLIVEIDLDVEILHRIITTAEQAPDVQAHPFRAIFAAYDAVLAQHGLDPDHDQIYLRFLLRLGGKRRAGETLYQSFESLLGELGIQIEINTEEDEVQEITRSLNQIHGETGLFGTQSVIDNESRVLSRRVSFDSIYDTENGNTRREGARSRSRNPVLRAASHQGSRLPARPYSRASTRPTERVQAQAQPLANAVRSGRRRLTAQDLANDREHYQRRNVSPSSHMVNLRNDEQVFMPSETPTLHQQMPQDGEVSPEELSLRHGSTKNQANPSEDRRKRSNRKNQSRRDIDPQALFYQPSKTQFLRDADTFQHFRIRSVARNAVAKWRWARLRAATDHARMNDIAISYDLGILLRQSFDQWRLNFQIQRQIAQTEHFFLRLEQRAGSARDLYLVTKAFTHWQQCAYEQRLKVSNARRHILSVKYFNAWVDLTTVNRAKVRRQGLQKFLEVWKQRCMRVRSNENRAIIDYDRVLTKRAYWIWIHAWCERRVPQWKNSKLKASCLAKWLEMWQHLSERDVQVLQLTKNSIKSKVLAQWLQKTRKALGDSQQALDFRDQQVLGHSVLAIKSYIKYRPLEKKVSNMVDWRVAGTTFASFISRYRIEQQAKNVNRLRIMRNAWTDWNDRLRWQTLAHQIDDRVMVESLYKWVILERCVLFQRLGEERLVKRHFWKLLQHRRDAVTTYENAHKLFKENKRRRTLVSIMDRWRSRLVSFRREEQVAHEFYAPRVAQNTILLWATGMRDWQKQSARAEDVGFYFTCTNCLRRWRAATAEAKRRKIHNAYVQVRRRIKMNLARRVIQQWHNLLNDCKQSQTRALKMNEDRLLRIGTSLFDRWRNRLDIAASQNLEAEDNYHQNLTQRHIDLWTQQFRIYQQHHQLARVTADLRISNIAFGWLHKMHLRMIEIRGRESNAESLIRWYEKRHFHNMLRRWREKTARKRDVPTPSRAFSARANRPKVRVDAESQDDGAGRAEDWTAFDEGFDIGDWTPSLEAESSTPMPGYLSTPSKRAARARNLVRVSTTPAGTPFAARLSSQPNTTPRSLKRGIMGSSIAHFRGSAFEPIQEDSPKTPGQS